MGQRTIAVPTDVIQALAEAYTMQVDSTDEMPVPLAAIEALVEAYAMQVYVANHCTLCGNRGVIDTRGVTTPAGVAVGRLNYCVCPNGMALRQEGGDMAWHLAAI